MTNVTKRALTACAGTIALACAVIQPANAADIPATPYYGGPPVQQNYADQENYVYQERRVYRQPPSVYYEQAPPAVVMPEPEPYYVPRRRVYVEPGYPGYGYGYRPYVARGYGYRHGGYHHHHHDHRGHHGHRRW